MYGLHTPQKEGLNCSDPLVVEWSLSASYFWYLHFFVATTDPTMYRIQSEMDIFYLDSKSEPPWAVFRVYLRGCPAAVFQSEIYHPKSNKAVLACFLT
jgi:hypothetical protein